MAEPILFVAGLGRCGTTMVMRMLDHGGITVAGPRPAYEVDHMRPRRTNLLWVSMQGHKAVKWIDPMVARIDFRGIPNIKPAFLFMRRDPEQQAKSMLKMAGGTASKLNVKLVAESIRRDNEATEHHLNQLGEVFNATFEWALKEPLQMAGKLGAICRHHLGRDINANAATYAVLRRRPYCAPDLAIEEALLAEVRNAH